MIAKPKVTVVGSMNVDIFLKMFRMPDLGETIASDSMSKAFGGKVSAIILSPKKNHLAQLCWLMTTWA